MTCKLCQRRVWKLAGDKPRCAFPVNSYTPDNWNCATMIAVRLLADPDGGQATAIWASDHTYSLVPIADAFPIMEDNDPFYLAMLLGWYKSRGNTFLFHFLDDTDLPRIPQWHEVWRVLHHYRKHNAQLRKYLTSIIAGTGVC